MNAVVQQDTSILFPPARIVQGDLYDPQDTDMQGNPLVIKSGQNAGQKRVNYFFSIAIPKQGEAGWWLTTWGAKIFQLAQGWWPQGQTQLPQFAWKISDGDDSRPNPEANMRRNCDREGFPGNWIVRLGSGFPTKVFDAQGNPLLQPGLVKRGFWVEVLANVSSNGNPQKPGIYVNHNMVAYRAPGKEIVSGPDPKAVGFGKSALPAGVTEQPIANVASMPGAAPGMPGMPGAPGAAPGMPGMPGAPGAAPGMPGMPGAPGMPGVPGGMPGAAMGAPAPGAMPGMPGAPGAMPGMPGVPGAAPGAMPGMPATPPQTAVTPHPGFMQPPAAGAMPGIPGAPSVPGAAPGVPGGGVPPAAQACPLGAPAGHRMANLNGPRYEAYRANGWQDAQLVAAGHMVRL